MIVVNSETYDAEVVNSDIPVLVDFSASWCAPCRALAPQLEALEASYEGKVKIVKVDIDESPELAQRFKFRGVPTLVSTFKGEQTAMQTGNPGTQGLKDILDALAAQA